MTGIERLRELAKGMHNHRVTVWQLTDDAYAERFGVTKHGPTIKNFLGDIADQIDREQDKVAQMDWEAVREVAADMAGRTFMSVTIDGLLCDWSRKLTSAADGHDHTNDVSMSAYDLLPQEDRDAIAWVREHGGLDSVKRLLDWVVGHCSTRQQLDFDFWLSGRVMHELGFDEDMADRDEVGRRLLARLMPEGMEWPMVDGKPVDFVTGYEPSLGVLEAVSIYSNGACEVMGHDGIIKDVKEIHVATPKALDADGVEIRVGDTVYEVEGTGHAYKVVGIRVGDGDPLTPTVATCDPGDGTSEHFLPSQLTHECPDSWERLWDDIENCEVGYSEFMRRVKALAGEA